jgi:hypothetical protein
MVPTRSASGTDIHLWSATWHDIMCDLSHEVVDEILVASLARYFRMSMRKDETMLRVSGYLTLAWRKHGDVFPLIPPLCLTAYFACEEGWKPEIRWVVVILYVLTYLGKYLLSSKEVVAPNPGEICFALSWWSCRLMTWRSRSLGIGV